MTRYYRAWQRENIKSLDRVDSEILKKSIQYIQSYNKRKLEISLHSSLIGRIQSITAGRRGFRLDEANEVIGEPHGPLLSIHGEPLGNEIFTYVFIC